VSGFIQYGLLLIFIIKNTLFQTAAKGLLHEQNLIRFAPILERKFEARVN
jgi:hypothetical protein